jgi:hypothetical protein
MWITQWRKGDGWLIFSPTRSVYSEPPTSSGRRSSRSAARKHFPGGGCGGCAGSADKKCMHTQSTFVGWLGGGARCILCRSPLNQMLGRRAHSRAPCMCVYKKNEFKFNLLLFKLFAGCCWENTSALPHTAGWLRLKVKYFYTLGRQTFLLLFMWVSLFFQPGENLNAHHASLTTDSIKFSRVRDARRDCILPLAAVGFTKFSGLRDASGCVFCFSMRSWRQGLRFHVSFGMLMRWLMRFGPMGKVVFWFSSKIF